MSRLNFPLPVRQARLEYATDKVANVIRCEGCGRIVKRGEYDFDHHLADWLGGKPTFENCRLLCTFECHPAKTRDDIKKISKTKRIQEDTLGTAKRSTLRGAKFKSTRKEARIPKDALPPLPRRNPMTGEVIQ